MQNGRKQHAKYACRVLYRKATLMEECKVRSRTRTRTKSSKSLLYVFTENDKYFTGIVLGWETVNMSCELLHIIT